MEMTKGRVIYKATIDYLNGLDLNNPPTPEVVEAELLEKIRFEFEIENAGKEKKRHWRIPAELDNITIARIIVKLHIIRRVIWAGDASGDNKNFDLMMYQTDGEQRGIYLQDDEVVDNLITEYCELINDRDRAGVIKELNRRAPKCKITADPNLIAVNNGIFNYQTKELLPFSPEYVFISKSSVDYVDNAKKTVIHNDTDGTDWDVESWVEDLSDDEGVPELLWQVLGSIVRPHVEWYKAVCFYSEQGNNGKGTLCSLMRNLCGPRAHASIPFEYFDQEFMLEDLLHISAIIVDENDTNYFTNGAGKLKATITGDLMMINRKFKKPVQIQFNGVMVQCMNSLPRFGDKTDSFYRRFLLVPFTKCYTGQERKYIKTDYLRRKEVLEYVLYKVLNTDYYAFSEPAACEELIEKYKVCNDPIRQFLDDVMCKIVWDLVPYSFLYDLYKVWYVRNNPSGKIIGKHAFTQQIKQIFINSNEWSAAIDTAQTVGKLMDKTELLIHTYDLTAWMNPSHKGNDLQQLCKPTLSGSYRGLKRIA